MDVEEARRIQLVHDLQLLDAEADPSFDALTELAASLCGTPMSLVSLVDRDRQFYTSRLGVDLRETPREGSFCAQAIEGKHEGEIFEVSDTYLDHRFRDNDLVVGKPHLRYYAGVPLRPTDHRAVGTLCVLDSEPGALSSQQRQDLLRLAGIAEQLLRLRLIALADAELRTRVEESERYYRYLAEHTTDVVFVHDPNLVRKYYSPNMPGFFGYTKEEVEALPTTHRFVSDEGLSRVVSGADGLTRDQPAVSFRAYATHKDGTLHDVSVHTLAIFENDSIIEFRSAVRDIAGLVDSERQIHAVNQELVMAEKRRSQAVSSIAHDLSAPLAAIRITAESVLEQMSPSALRAQVDNLVDFAGHASALIGDLRLVNDPDVGDPTMTFASHDLGSLIERSTGQLLGDPHYAGVQLDLDEVVAVVDEHAVARIVTNLVRNALGHNPPGTKVVVRLRAGEDGAVLEVEDDGRGIPSADRRRMLEPYAALNPGGSGLGLAITNALVTAHHGTVRIAGNDPSGTIVSVSFPK